MASPGHFSDQLLLQCWGSVRIEMAEAADDATAALAAPALEVKQGCGRAQAALDFLDSLQLSDCARAAAAVANDNPRFACEQCGRETRLYCTRCMWSALPLPIVQ